MKNVWHINKAVIPVNKQLKDTKIFLFSQLKILQSSSNFLSDNEKVEKMYRKCIIEVYMNFVKFICKLFEFESWDFSF
jgi:hypothetical protein